MAAVIPHVRGCSQGGVAAAGAWPFLILLSAIGLVAYTDRFILNVLVAPLKRDLGLSDIQFGLLVGPAFALAVVAASLPSGRLADLVPRKPMMIAALTLWTIASLISAFSTGFAMIAACRLFIGIGEAALFPLTNSLLGDLFPKRLIGRALGIAATGVMLGGAGAYIGGGPLFGLAAAGSFRHLPLVGGLSDWRLVLLLMTAPNLVLITLLAFMREPPRGRFDVESSSANLTKALPVLVRHRFFLAVVVLTPAVVSVADYAILTWSPTMVSRAFQMPEASSAPIIGTLGLLATVAAALFAGFCADTVFPRGGTRAQCLLGACAIVLMALAAPFLLAKGLAIVLVGYCGLAFGVIFAEAISSILLQNCLSTRTRGIGTASMTLVMAAFGMGLGPLAPPLVARFTTEQNIGFGIVGTVIPVCAIAFVLFSVCWRMAQSNSDIKVSKAAPVQER